MSINSHVAKSLPLTNAQSETCFSVSFWKNTFSSEMDNVRRCVMERKTQLVARNKKLVLLDTELCRSFAKGNSCSMKEQSVLFVLCHEFIKISKSLRYSKGNLQSLPAFVLNVFSYPGHNVLA